MELEEINELLMPSFDDYGLIIHWEDDQKKVRKQNGGDSCQRTMTYFIFLWILTKKSNLIGPFFDVYAKFHLGNGVYIRHPSKGYHCGVDGFTNYECWNDPKNFSPDQTRALIVGMQFYSLMASSRRLFGIILKNFSRFQNNDICFLAEYGALIRASRLFILWPLLFVCDAWLCVANAWTVGRYFCSVVKSNLTGSKIYTDGYINGLLLSLSTREMPTPLGWLARKIIRIKCADAWDYYFQREGDPQLNLFIPLIRKYL